MYEVVVRKADGSGEAIEFYGVDKIGSEEEPPDPTQFADLCKQFGVAVKDVERPNRVDMMISQGKNHLFPNPVKKESWGHGAFARSSW